MRKKSLLMAALFVIFLMGCKNEQSDLTLDALGESAIITGQVMYSAGIDTIGNDYTADDVRPASGRKVVISVPLSEYKKGSTGTRTFECVIDSAGYFVDTIPCMKEGVNNVSLHLEEFTAQRNMEFIRMENGKPVFDVRMCKYEGEMSNISLKPGMNYLEEVINYSYTPIDMSEYDESAILTGVVRLPVETAYGIGSYVNAANCNLEITIQDGVDISENKVQPFTYGVTTDDKGAFRLALPLKSLKAGFQLNEIFIPAKNEKAFTHFKKDGSTVTFAGAYKLRINEGRSVNYYAILDNIVKDIDCNIGSLAMEFLPNYNNNIAERIEPAGWNSNLAGWMFGWADFADYTESTTLSGQVKMAKETKFGVGEYVAAVREIVSLKINDPSYPISEFEVPTDESGKYSIAIPVKQAKVKAFDVEVALKQPETISFTHFSAPDKSRELKAGEWIIYKTLRGQDADWNLLGTTYCKFNPAESLGVNTFASNLLGWYKTNDTYKTPTISGIVKLAKEDEFAKGSYVKANGLRVRISLDRDTVVVPLNNGAFSFEFPIATENKKFSPIDVSLLDSKELAFAHYTTNKTMKLEGVYETYKQEKEGGAEWYECGTYYYKFKPSTQEDSYLDCLAGWQVVPKYDASVTVSGEVFLPYEKSYAIGAYRAAKNQCVVVTIDPSESGEIAGMQFAAPLDANGKFTLAIPMEQEGDKLDYRPAVEVGGSVENNFVHYKDFSGSQCNLKGIYENPKQIIDPKAENTVLGKIYFSFTPNGANKQSNVESFDDNLVGWYVAPFDYIKGDIFTGTVMKPKEDSFWKGSYTSFANQKIEIWDDYLKRTFVVLTDGEGKYSYQSYKKKENDRVKASLLLTSDHHRKEKAFVHYANLNNPKEVLVEGKYSISFPNDWSEKGANMGTTYLAFIPNEIPDDWANNLYGWQQVKFVEQGESKGTAKFQLYAQKAKEEATTPHEAIWTDAGKQKVIVSVSNTKDKRSSYSFSTLSSGKSISFNLPWTTELDGASTAEVTVRFSCYTDNNSTFVHYPELEETTSKSVKGNWSSADNIYNETVIYDEANSAFECKKSAKLYFKPEKTPDGWWQYNWTSIVDQEIE